MDPSKSGMNSVSDVGIPMTEEGKLSFDEFTVTSNPIAGIDGHRMCSGTSQNSKAFDGSPNQLDSATRKEFIERVHSLQRAFEMKDDPKLQWIAGIRPNKINPALNRSERVAFPCAVTNPLESQMLGTAIMEQAEHHEGWNVIYSSCMMPVAGVVLAFVIEGLDTRLEGPPDAEDGICWVNYDDPNACQDGLVVAYGIFMSLCFSFGGSAVIYGLGYTCAMAQMPKDMFADWAHLIGTGRVEMGSTLTVLATLSYMLAGIIKVAVVYQSSVFYGTLVGVGLVLVSILYLNANHLCRIEIMRGAYEKRVNDTWLQMQTPEFHFMQRLGLEHHFNKLVESEVDMESLVKMRELDLKEIGIPKGPRMKMMAALKAMCESERICDSN